MFTIRFVPAALLTAAAAGFFVSAASAADWPCFRGPDRTGVSKETGLLKSWPAGGPKLLWTFDAAGSGYSSVSVVGDKLFTMGERDGGLSAICVDAKTGKQLWATKIGGGYNNGWGGGPRGMPTVDGDAVYCLGAGGELACLAVADGKVRWQKHLINDFGGKGVSNWGYSESPLIDGDKLVCTPGGGKGAVLALDKNTGNTLWQSRDFTDGTQYASPTPCEIGGVRQYVVMTGQTVAGIAAADGKTLWRFARSGPTAAIPSPIVEGNHVFATSGYNAGCHLIKVTADGGAFKAEEVYSNKTMSNHHGGVILVDGHVYGHSNGRKGWLCQEFLTGKEVWAEARLDKGSIAYADGRLYCYGERSGTCVLIEASSAGWKEHGKVNLPRQSRRRDPWGGIWSHPVISDGKLFLRDQELLFCFDIKGK